MKKIIIGIIFMVVACNSFVFAKGAKGSSNSEVVSDFSVGVVTDTGGVDDRSFNQGTWEGAQRYASEVGGDAKYLQSTADADYVPNLSTFADEGKTLIIAPGFLLDTAIAEVAKNNPEQNFLIIDTVVAGIDNVSSAVFAANEGSFLAGVVAAMETKKTGASKIGLVLGMDLPPLQLFEAGFEAGIKAIDPSLELLIEIPNSFMDAQKGQTLASKLYDQGAKVIFSVAGATGNGCIKEAKDRRVNNKEVWIIGVDRDQYEDGIYDGVNSCILTSNLKRVDVAAYQYSKLAHKGSFPGGTELVFDLKMHGVGLPEVNPNLSKDILKIVKEYESKIILGDIVVPKVPSRIK